MLLKLEKVFPRTKVLLLRWVVVVLSILFILLGSWIVYFNGLGVFTAGFFVLMLTISIFLWRMHSLACGAAKFVLAMAIIVPLLGFFNPFFTLDYYDEVGSFPDWWMIAARLSPIVLVAIFFFGVLDRYKGQFSVYRKMDGGGRSD